MARELSNGINLKGPLQLNGAAGTSGQILTSAGTGALPTWSAAGGFTGGTLTSNLTLASGTTSLSPLTFQSGTNLTSATAGVMEYDGKVFYSTPNATSGRGLSPSTLLYRAGSTGIAGSRVTTAQAAFGAGLTVVASTVYQFEMVLESYKSTGASSYQWGYLFGGTASLTNFGSTFAISRNTASPSMTFPTNASCFQGIQTSTTVYYPYGSDSNTAAIFHLVVKGSFAVTSGGGGTFIPQYQLSADPGGAFTTQAGSYITVTPIGTGTGAGNTSIGAWA